VSGIKPAAEKANFPARVFYRHLDSSDAGSGCGLFGKLRNQGNGLLNCACSWYTPASGWVVLEGTSHFALLRMLFPGACVCLFVCTWEVGGLVRMDGMGI
jgi:hypothetical protein